MADYKRKRKGAGRSSSGRRSYSKRPYLPNLGGGGYSGPRNYFRAHDFRYEREPSTKPPKTETHYEVIERPSAESYRLPAYRPEPDPTLMEKAVGHAMERYLRNDSEQKLESQSQAEARVDSETPPNLQEVGLEANQLVEKGAATIEEKAPEIDLTQPAEPLVEISQESDAIIDKGAELYETYELPVADLELLLIELDANPLEVMPEKNVEVEGAQQ